MSNNEELENKNNDEIAELIKKYDNITSAHLSVNYWPYWIISSIGISILLYVLGVNYKSSILIGGISGIVIALFWQNHTKSTKKKSQAYADIQKQRAYAVKALKNSLLPESRVEGKADFNPAIVKANFFQTPSPNEHQKVSQPYKHKHPIRKIQSNKWRLLFYFGLALFVLLIITGNVEYVTNLYNSSPVASDKEMAERNQLTIKKTRQAILKNTDVYKADINLRHCLDLPTKEEVILCSEQAK